MAKKTPKPAWRNRIVGHADVAPAELHPSPLNWRVHPAPQQTALVGALSSLGWIQHVVVSQRSGTLIDGHLRVALALERNEPTVPVLYVDLSAEEERLALATLDPIGMLAEADRDALSQLLAQVQSDEPALQQMLSDLAEQNGIVPPQGTTGGAVEEGPEPQVDRAEELRQHWGVEVGQMWQLGQHRILCADCLSLENIQRLLGDETPAMIFADPPYGVEIVATNESVGGGEAYNIPFGGVKNRNLGSVGAAKPFGSRKVYGTVGSPNIIDVGKYAPMLGDDSPATAITAATTLLEAFPTAAQVWWGGNYYADALPPSSCWLVWNKETTGNFADCELAWTNQPKAARLFTHRWNGMLRDSERERRMHPTQKPAALAVWVYETLGHSGDVVLDPFLGCGPTIIAGEQTSRRVYGCELSPEYIAIILQRWADLTGQTPVLLGVERPA